MTQTIEYQDYQPLKKKCRISKTKLPPFAKVMAQVANFSHFE
jgi:hypothetical protein